MVDLAGGLHEQLLFPPDLGAANHLRQQAAHDRFDRAAVVGAHPARELEELFAQDWGLADDGFNGSNTLRLTFVQDGHHCGKRGFVAKWNAHPRADTDSLGHRFRDEIIELAMDGAVDNYSNEVRLEHGLLLFDRRKDGWRMNIVNYAVFE